MKSSVLQPTPARPPQAPPVGLSRPSAETLGSALMTRAQACSRRGHERHSDHKRRSADPRLSARHVICTSRSPQRPPGLGTFPGGSVRLVSLPRVPNPFTVPAVLSFHLCALPHPHPPKKQGNSEEPHRLRVAERLSDLSAAALHPPGPFISDKARGK